MASPGFTHAAGQRHILSEYRRFPRIRGTFLGVAIIKHDYSTLGPKPYINPKPTLLQSSVSKQLVAGHWLLAVLLSILNVFCRLSCAAGRPPNKVTSHQILYNFRFRIK